MERSAATGSLAFGLRGLRTRGSFSAALVVNHRPFRRHFGSLSYSACTFVWHGWHSGTKSINRSLPKFLYVR